MIHLTIENEHGSIVMGGHARDTWRIRAIDGLGPVETEAKTVQYVGIPGQTTLEVLPRARTITITADLNTRDADQRQWRLSQAMRILNTTGRVTLRVNFSGKMREITCRPLPSTLSHFNAAAQEVTISLLADNPYFRDTATNIVPLRSRAGNLYDGMTFPRIFTYRYPEGTAVNMGDADVEPVIVITAGTLSEKKDIVLLENKTTGAAIRFNYTLQSNETITVDIANRTVQSNISGNILRYKDRSTVLGSFVLRPGKNVIRFGEEGDTQPITAQLSYSNLYAEAVY